MLNIPDEVKDLFKLDRCNKNFRVHFPNGEMDDLTNADMVQESVEFSESICSQNTFKFGLSESSTISFETVGVPNMMGKKIECGIEIDCTSLGAAWAAGHPVDNTLPFLEPQTAWVYDSEPELNEETGSIISLFNDDDSTIDSLTIPITPTQNLNGYSKPWAAGGGDNKFEPMSGVNNGVKFTVQDDGSVKITGTATVATYTFRNQYVDLPYHGISAGDTVVLWSDIYAVVGSYNGSTSLGNKTSSNGNANIYTIPAEATRLRFIEYAKPTPTSAGEVFDTVGHYYFAKSDSFSSWTPYSNICPITGLTGLSVYVSPTQDVADATTYAEDWTSQAGTVYAGDIEVVSGALKARPRYASYNGETLVGPWLSSMDEYAAGTTPTIGAEVVDLGGSETAYQLTTTQIPLSSGQNYIWASTGSVLTAVVEKGEKKLFYRVPYGQFTVRECPRDHQAMTHRKVTAYTDTRFVETEYQKMLMNAKGVDKKYTPKFQNMFYSAVGRNNEDVLINVGYTRALHLQLSSNDVEEFVYSYFKSFNGTGGRKYFEVILRIKRVAIFGDGTGTPPTYIASSFITNDAIYGIEGFENIKNENLINAIAEILVSDYGVSESDAYNYSNYLNREREFLVNASLNRPKIIGFATLKDVGGSWGISISPYLDIVDMSGLYCINPDRESVLTTISVISSITLTPWSNDDYTGHATGDPIVSEADGLDDAYINQYTAPSGSAFDTELKLEPTGSESSGITGATKLYWFTDAVDISKLMTDYLEVNALFAAQNRTGGLRTFSLDNFTPREELSAGDYAEFWWDEYDVSPIGKIKYMFTKKEEEEEITYTFGSGQSVYDLTQNEFFKQFKKSKSEIETFLDVSFIPKLGAVAFTPIELTVGNGLPYIEAGDYIQATSEDGVDAKSFVLTHTISGIQHLTESIESTGGDLMNSVFSEGN